MFIAIGIPLAVERVPPYHWYGFRSAKTFSIQTIWYAANRVAGIDLIIAGVVVALECWRCSFCARLPIARWGFGLSIVAMTVVVLQASGS